VLNRPHRLYLMLAATWLAIIVFVSPERWWSAAAVSIVVGILAAFYFQASSKVFATRLLERAATGDERAKALYLARSRSRLGDIAREYLGTLLGASDERLLPLIVRQLDHPDAQARELTEDRLARWGTRAADPLVQAAIGHELSGDGAFRARRLLYRWRPELPSNLTALLDSAGYWKDA
jgi:hypothetical protein